MSPGWGGGRRDRGRCSCSAGPLLPNSPFPPSSCSTCAKTCCSWCALIRNHASWFLSKPPIWCAESSWIWKAGRGYQPAPWRGPGQQRHLWLASPTRRRCWLRGLSPLSLPQISPGQPHTPGRGEPTCWCGKE